MDRHLEFSKSEKQKARLIANEAQRRGLLVKQPCEKCGTQRTQKHHDDYSKPLEIRWLCWHCHASEHGGTYHIGKFGKGNCARCSEPKVRHRAYCKQHWKEYQKGWRDARNDKFRELLLFKRKHSFHDSGNVQDSVAMRNGAPK